MLTSFIRLGEKAIIDLHEKGVVLYGQFLAGPEPFKLDNERLSVWPLLDFVAAHPNFELHGVG